MATSTKSATDDLQVQVLDTIRKGQEAVVDGLRSWTEAAEQFVPRTAAWPGADRYPSPAELVDTAYDFAALLFLQPQRFLERIGVRLIDFDRYHFLLPGEYPRKITVRGPLVSIASLRLPGPESLRLVTNRTLPPRPPLA